MPPDHTDPSRPALWAIAVHGGAGAMRQMSRDKEAAYRAGLDEAVRTGGAALAAGRSAVEAVIEAVRSMERCGAFNAGRGACLNQAGHIEVDAAVMCASDASIGAVAAVPGLANGVAVADAVRRLTPHCLLAGPGALLFAQQVGLPIESVFPQPAQIEQYRRLLAAQTGQAPQRAEDLARLGGTHDEGDTVGAVALDLSGDMAVAASTGGLWLKLPGRVGDSPLPGAGYWARAGVGAAAATGTGETILRTLLCRRAVDLLAAGAVPSTAARTALDELAHHFGRGKAGLLLVDSQGRMALDFDTEGMGRGAWWSGAADPRLAVWPEEGLRSVGEGE